MQNLSLKSIFVTFKIENLNQLNIISLQTSSSLDKKTVSHVGHTSRTKNIPFVRCIHYLLSLIENFR